MASHDSRETRASILFNSMKYKCAHLELKVSPSVPFTIKAQQDVCFEKAISVLESVQIDKTKASKTDIKMNRQAWEDSPSLILTLNMNGGYPQQDRQINRLRSQNRYSNVSPQKYTQLFLTRAYKQVSTKRTPFRHAVVELLREEYEPQSKPYRWFKI
jgi:hypothetical protein